MPPRKKLSLKAKILYSALPVSLVALLVLYVASYQMAKKHLVDTSVEGMEKTVAMVALAQIKSAILEIDRMIQNVASEAEESAAASEEVSSQSAEMRASSIDMRKIIHGR